MASQLFWGQVPVPYTVAWTDEEPIFLAKCKWANRTAICQVENRGSGKPKFGSPHMNRQRQVIAEGRCDLCGQRLNAATKVSLSQARPVVHAAKAFDILQVEPLLHRKCAAICYGHCPSLKRQREDGTLHIRQVFRYQVQFALYSEEGTFQATGIRQKSISHAKVQRIKFADLDLDWLMRGAA